MISEEMAAFLPSGLSIVIASRGRDLSPDGARASAVVVDEDRLHMTVFVPSERAEAILHDLKKAPRVAVLFVRPTDDRACQLKGTFAGSRRGRPSEREAVRGQFDAFRAALETIGIARSLTAGWKQWPCVAIRIRVTEMFNQTPGPGAGGPMA